MNTDFETLRRNIEKAFKEFEDATKLTHESKDKDVHAKWHRVLHIDEEIIKLALTLDREVKSRKESE